MGISSSLPIAEYFDGQSSDHDIDPQSVISQRLPVLPDSDINRLQQQFAHLSHVPNLEDIEKFTFKGQIVAGKCVKVYDGDTAHFAVFYNGKWVRRRFRFIGYNSPEVRGGTAEEKEAGIKARNYLAQRLLDKSVILYLHDFDKWGRILCDVYLLDDEDNVDNSTLASAVHINSEMIKMGHGRPYRP